MSRRREHDLVDGASSASPQPVAQRLHAIVPALSVLVRNGRTAFVLAVVEPMIERVRVIRFPERVLEIGIPVQITSDIEIWAAATFFRDAVIQPVLDRA